VPSSRAAVSAAEKVSALDRPLKPCVCLLRRLVRVPLGAEHDRRGAVAEVAPEVGPHRLRACPLDRRLRRPEAVVVAGGLEEEAAGVPEEVVPVRVKLRGPLGLPVDSHPLILPILATERSPLSGEPAATFEGDAD
jgi:hypothetical protein